MTRTNKTHQITAHTPEPWQIHRLNNGWPMITSDAHDIADLRLNGSGLPHVDANAHCICAAVNACQGISTEALEQGIVADLRHILGELLDADADLDAAIDGATEEFDSERARLNAALGLAQAVLDGRLKLDLHELLAARGQIALAWSIEDMQEVRPDLTDEQAWQVLEKVERRHDASIGITWDTLEWTAEDLFGSAPETTTEEKQP